MASADGDVQQLLASRTTTPITQLKPELPDQAARKIHGEVTITWPYSSISKSFAFLLAEPDFRLRREKGQVRIVLNGPSAEAISNWELGSGDEVTLALDGVEWAKDEEPSRPPGSRLDWQLKFAGKLMLQATLGESQETKFISIDQPVPTDPVEAPEPIHFAEIDTTIFDDAPPTGMAPAIPTMAEFASPRFMKRSRASYGPLFELDLDDEFEDDGGSRGKGRKRPRYSVQNGRWRYREESDSPEPEVLQDSPSPVPEPDSDVVMQDTHSKPQMTDGACQTDENDLLPPPQSTENTPSKSWIRTEPSSAFGNGVLDRSDAVTTDMGVQASSSRDGATVSDEKQNGQQLPMAAIAPNTSNLFDFMPDYSGLPQSESNVRTGFSMSQTGTSLHVPISQQMQASSLFGTGPAPTQPMLDQPSNIGAGFCVMGGSLAASVRFGFGQQPESTFGGMQFAPSQLQPQYYDTHYYPASYTDPQQASDHASPASHHFQGEPTQHARSSEEAGTTLTNVPSNQVLHHGLPSWPIEAHTSDPSHVVDHLNAPEELRSDGSVPEETTPGMIPPAVADGTRNRDEMREEGILSEPVFEQGVPRAALPHGRERSADEDEYSMDRDEEADYDEDEKGVDYDMRNYDSVSDDDEGFDGEDETLPDGEMLDEDEDEFSEDEEGYDEEDYEEDDYATASHHQQAPQAAPQPPTNREPVFIDLLSDSDEENEAAQAPPLPQNQIERHQIDGFANSEPEDDCGDDLVRDDRPQHFTEADRKRRPKEYPEKELREEVKQELSEQVDDVTEASSSHDKRQSAGASITTSEDDEVVGEESKVEEDETEDVGMREDVRTINENIIANTNASIPEVEKAASSSPPRPHTQAESDVEEGPEEDMQVEEITGCAEDENRQHAGQEHDMSGNDEPQDSIMAESFQTQSVEMAASFQTEAGDSSEPFQTQTTDMNFTGLPELSQGTRLSQEDLDGDNVMEEAQLDAATDKMPVVVPEKAVGEADVEDSAMQQPREKEVELLDEGGKGDDAEGMVTESQAQEDASEVKIFEGFSDDQHDAPPSPPVSQNHEDHAAPRVDTSMTTVSSHIETQFSDKKTTMFETQETEVMLSHQSQVDEDRMSVTDEKGLEGVEAVAASGEELEGNAESIEDRRLAPDDGAQVTAESDLALSEAIPEPLGDASVAASAVPEQDIEPGSEQEVEGTRQRDLDTSSELSGEEFHDASELLQTDRSLGVVHNDDRASFVTADSQASESRDTEETRSSPTPRPRRKARDPKNDFGFQYAMTAIAANKGQHVPSGQPTNLMTTRSKAMAFQKASSPQNNHEDMSIRLARAALKSPSKVSATTSNKVKDLVKRLRDEMPECVPLKDLKSYNQINLDVAAVATSQPTPPQRTKARQYATCFTATDPSIAPNGVIEVSLFRAHKDFLPIVKPGDSILLRGFTVRALPKRGFGLQTHPEASSWAVFDTDGDGALPQIRGPPVELSEEEKDYLVDLRGWYATLDEDAKDKLAKAAGEMVEKGRTSRGEK